LKASEEVLLFPSSLKYLQKGIVIRKISLAFGIGKTRKEEEKHFQNF